MCVRFVNKTDFIEFHECNVNSNLNSIRKYFVNKRNVQYYPRRICKPKPKHRKTERTKDKTIGIPLIADCLSNKMFDFAIKCNITGIECYGSHKDGIDDNANNVNSPTHPV